MTSWYRQLINIMDGNNKQTRISHEEQAGRITFITTLNNFLWDYLLKYEEYPLKDHDFYLMLFHLKAAKLQDAVIGREWKYIAQWCDDRRDCNYLKLLKNTKFVQIKEYSLNNFLYAIFFGHVKWIKKVSIPLLPVWLEILKHNIWVPDDTSSINKSNSYFTLTI